MKHINYSWLLIFIGVFLITNSIVLSNSLIVDLQEINGRYGMDKINISLKKDKTYEKDFAFTVDDVQQLQSILTDCDITYTAHCQTRLENTTYDNINIVGTNYKYIDFCNLQFLNGFFFTESSQLENDKVIVIDENLAFEIFGSNDIIGNYIKLFDDKFQIIGINSVNRPILDFFYYPKDTYIYMPIQSLLNLNQNVYISSLQIKNHNNKNITNNISNALKVIDKDPENYNILNYKTKEILITQKISLIIFFLGGICMLIITKYIMDIIKKIYFVFYNELHNYYLSDILIQNLNKLFWELLKIFCLILVLFILYKIIKFNLYIPPESIPEELTDIQFFWNLFKQNIFSNLDSMGYDYSFNDLKFKSIVLILKWIFYTSVFIGFPCIYIGFYQLQLQHIKFLDALYKITIIFVFCIALSMFCAFLSNISLLLNTTNLIILLSFFYLNLTIFFLKTKEGT